MRIILEVVREPMLALLLGGGAIYLALGDGAIYLALGDLTSLDSDYLPCRRSGSNLLHVLIVLARSRREVLHFNVAADPTAHWVAQMAEALPWDSAPRYLLLDRDAIYGGAFRKRIRAGDRAA